jgi:hypothetical protein
MPEPTAPTTPATQRDGQGRFLPNNSGGPGNPFARQVALLRKALIAAVSADDIAAIAEKLKEKALAGDLAAIKILFGYVLGKPTPVPDPDEVENREKQEETKLETLVGRIVMPVLRRGCVPRSDDAAESGMPQPAPAPSTGRPAAAVNKPAPGAAPGTPTPGNCPAAAAVAAPPRSPDTAGNGAPQSRPRSAGPEAVPPAPGKGATRQQTGSAVDRLMGEEKLLRPGWEQVDLTILGGS